MEEIFNKYIVNAFGEAKQSVSRMKQFTFNYRKYFPLNDDAKVLDIGIGRGEMLTCMRSWGYVDYLGVDISPDTVLFCKSIGLNCIQVSDTTEWLKEHKDSFNAITLLDVLEHIKKEQLIEFLKAIKVSLKKNGVLIVQVPNMQAPDGYLHRYNDITHELGFIEHSLQQVLTVAGFNNFIFLGFEELIFGLKDSIKRILRIFFWWHTKFVRIINGNLNPPILNPVFYAIVRND